MPSASDAPRIVRDTLDHKSTLWVEPEYHVRDRIVLALCVISRTVPNNWRS